MDTPKRKVSWLESFPPDIWAYIVCYLPGEQLGRLLMTGATFLWQRLKSPTVVKTIKLGQDFMVFQSLPKFLNDFISLEELSIHSCDDEWSRKLSLKVNSIPFGLRKLEYHRRGGWAGGPFQLFGESGTTLKLKEHLPHLEVLDLGGLALPDYPWTTHSPQSLTHLTLHIWNGTVELPSSLIHFKTTNGRLSPISFVSKLPSSLESFIVSWILEGIELVVPLLPPSLRILALGAEADFSSDGARSPQILLLENLPTSLTWFSVPYCPQIDFGTNPELLSFLPSTLTELNILPDFHCSSWSHLPPQLTKLKFSISKHSLGTTASNIINNHGTNHQLPSLLFHLLPRSITSLRITTLDELFCGPPEMSFSSYFPPQLKKLAASRIQLSPETAKLLPSSLTYLELGNFCERVCENLPTGLKTLKSSQVLMSPNLIKFLPKSLSVLSLPIALCNRGWYHYKTGKSMFPISKLPEYSIQENCLSNSFDWNDLLLPPTLISLDLEANELGDSFLLHQQIPNLLNLRMHRSKHISDLSIPLLCPLLTTLNFGSSSNISGKSFEFLPRCLTVINLSSSGSVFDSDIQHLPRTLKRLYLNSAIHLTDVCIADLPPHLECLDMGGNSLIPTHSFPRFPYSLRSHQHQYSVEFANWKVKHGVIHLKHDTINS